ncbi:hypothetical protein [Microcoleus vaginatus]|uniref:hypothetical protein n=1 Tax=Microcoleus vaginatus TaxID=119532 RepID=UPI00403F5A8B
MLFTITNFAAYCHPFKGNTAINFYNAIAFCCHRKARSPDCRVESQLLCKLLSHLIPSALGELFAEVNQNGYITLADRYGLMAAIFDENLTEEDKRSIDRLLRSVCRGRIKLVNELSMIR